MLKTAGTSSLDSDSPEVVAGPCCGGGAPAAAAEARAATAASWALKAAMCASPAVRWSSQVQWS